MSLENTLTSEFEGAQHAQVVNQMVAHADERALVAVSLNPDGGRSGMKLGAVHSID
ncbi:hypothetical protein [Rhodococcus sp. NPDC076796]|uniref:hypothetical protein n=1 Tax=Rhodococcus sp. NPDC076796 TaxID=3154859 RepID=UPI002AD62525|nr:hypothetical protein [Rhodococcus sp. (in: high G+C Gram-positive bacteria)]